MEQSSGWTSERIAELVWNDSELVWSNRMWEYVFAGPVYDVETATSLEELGASIIAVTPSFSPRGSPSSLALSLDAATAIAASLRAAELCLLMDPRQECELHRRWCARLRPDWVAVDVRHPEAERMLTAARAVESKVLMYGFTLDYDEDPGWAEAQLAEAASSWKPSAIILTLLPGLRRPLQWLRDESGQFGEDVTVDDIERLVRLFPIVLNIEMLPEDVVWFDQALASALGVAFFLASPRSDGGCPWLSEFIDVVGVLNSLARAGVEQ